MDIKQYLVDITRFKELSDELPEDNPAALMKKIDLLTDCLVLIGDVAGEYARMYKITHVKRDMEYAQAYIVAEAPKKERAELETKAIRELEAELWGWMHKYKNDFESTKEAIYKLRLKMRFNLADGSSRYQGGR